MAHRPRSPAAILLRRLGAPTAKRTAELADTSEMNVSRMLAGLQPMSPAVLAVLRVLIGPEETDQVAALAEESRAAYRRQVVEAVR